MKKMLLTILALLAVLAMSVAQAGQTLPQAGTPKEQTVQKGRMLRAYTAKQVFLTKGEFYRGRHACCAAPRQVQRSGYRHHAPRRFVLVQAGQPQLTRAQTAKLRFLRKQMTLQRAQGAAAGCQCGAPCGQPGPR